MNAINIKLYQILKNDFHLSDEKAREFAQAINDVASENIFVSEFKSNVKEDLLRLEMNVKTEIKNLELKIEQTKSDLLKWFIGLFIALALMIIGLYLNR